MALDKMRADELEARLMAEIVRRRGLGEYNPDAKTLMMMCETLYELVRDAAPKSRKDK